MKTQEERIAIVKSIVEGWGYNIERIIEAEDADMEYMAYFDDKWGLDQEELAEYPEGKWVSVSGSLNNSEEADAVFSITRDDKGLAIYLF